MGSGKEQSMHNDLPQTRQSTSKIHREREIFDQEEEKTAVYLSSRISPGIAKWKCVPSVVCRRSRKNVQMLQGTIPVKLQRKYY